MKIKRGRLDRRSFVIGFIFFELMKIIAVTPAYILFFIDSSARTVEAETSILFNLTSIYTPTGIIFHTLSILVIIWSLQIYIRRFRDIGKSGAISIIILIDFIVGRIFAHYAGYIVNANQTDVVLILISQIPNIFSLAVGIMLIYLIITKGKPGVNAYGQEISGKVPIKNILFNR